MINDALGKEIRVGDIMIYGAGRGCIEYGLVCEVEEHPRGTYNGIQYVDSKIKIARVNKNRAYIRGAIVDYGDWIVKRVTHGNHHNSVVLDDEQCLLKEEYETLLRYRTEILTGAKKVGTPNGVE